MKYILSIAILSFAVLSHFAFNAYWQKEAHRIQMQTLSDVKRMCDHDKYLLLDDSGYRCTFKGRLPKHVNEEGGK